MVKQLRWNISLHNKNIIPHKANGNQPIYQIILQKLIPLLSKET